MGSINIKGFQPVPKTTKFGGIMLAVAIFSAMALCTDILVQYVAEYGLERSWSAPAVDSQTIVTTNARVDLSLTAIRSPAQQGASCRLVSLLLSPSVLGGFSLVSQSEPSPDLPNVSASCSFKIKCNTMTVDMSPYASPVVPGTVTIALGAFLQLSSWTLKVGDAKPGAYTTGQLNSRWEGYFLM